MRRFAFIALLFALLAPTMALAVTPDEMLKDPALEARARASLARAALPGLPEPGYRRFSSGIGA